MPRKIMFASSILRYGGGERWMLDAASGLRERGHRVLLVSRPGSVLGSKARAKGMDCVDIEMRGELDPAAVAALTARIRSFHPDVVCPNLDREIRLCGLAVLFAGRLRRPGAPLQKSATRLIPRRGSDFPLKNNVHYRFFYTNFIHAVIANSQATKRTMLSRTPWFPRDKVQVVYNGIDLTTYGPQPGEAGNGRKKLREEFGIADHAPLVTLIGELNERKGQLHLIEAAERIRRDHPATRFLLVGEGDARRNIEQVLEEKKLKDIFILAGFREDIAGILAASDMLVLPSRVEGFGYVLVEAMAAGLPVVASRASSIPEIVVDEETGLLHEVANSDQIARCISRLIGDRNLADKFGKAGRARAERMFSLGKMLDRLEEVFWRER